MDLKRPVNSDPRRDLPSVDRLIRAVAARDPEIPHWATRQAARAALQVLREGSVDRDSPAIGDPGGQIDLEHLTARVVRANAISCSILRAC